MLVATWTPARAEQPGSASIDWRAVAAAHAQVASEEAAQGPRLDAPRPSFSLSEPSRPRLIVRLPVDDAWEAALAARATARPDAWRALESHPLRMEFSWAAPMAGGFDLGVAHRTAIGGDDRLGAIESRGAEVRFGQRLENPVRTFQSPSWDKPSWYLFAASDGEALTWQPREGAALVDPLRYQERVTVGDMQAGLSVEANGVQASLSYMQREVSNGQRSDDQRHVGVSVTLRR